MLPGNMMRLVCAVAGVAMVLSGCASCGGPGPVDCTDTTIAFETPTADQTVDSPFEVSVNVKLPDGAAFGIDSAQLSVSDGAPINGTVSGNRATFAGVTAAPGAQTLAVTIAKGSCSKSSSAQTITVRDACTTAAVTAVSFPQDTAAGGLGVLNRAELPPGTNLQVQVDARCVTDVQVRIKRGTTEVSPLTSFVNGSAVITLPSLPDSDNADYDLFAELVRGGVALNSPSTVGATGTIRVRRAQPSCAVTTMGTFGPTGDVSSATGYQMRVVGTMDANSTGTLAVNGQSPVAVTPGTMSIVSADFTLPGSGAYTATLTCTDANANTNTATGTFTVNLDPLSVTIVSPANVDGGATMVVTQSPLQVQVATNAPDGSTARISQNGTPMGSRTVVGGMVTLPVSFGLDGVFTLIVEVSDPIGNVGSATLVVTVTLDGCGGIFSRPGACPALLTPTQLVGGAYSFQTTSKAACANQPAALFRADVLGDGGTTAEVAAGTANLTGGGIANFPPLSLASGGYVLRAQVSNVGVDAGVSQVSCQVTVDLEGPSITSPVQPTGAPYATVNANQDALPLVPGVQRPASIGGLSFSARVPSGGRVDVCTTQQFNADVGMNRPTSPECGSGWYVLIQGVVSPVDLFTFPEGNYQIKIVVVGGGLAVAPSSAPLPILSDSIRPCLTGRLLPQDGSADGQLNIAELNGAAPKLEFALGCGDTSPADLAATTPVGVRNVVSGVPAAPRASTAVFAGGKYGVDLPVPGGSESDLNLFIELTDLAGNKNLYQPSNDPSSFLLRVDLAAPVCDILSPGPSQTLIGIAGAPGGTFPMQIATSADVGTNGVHATFGAVGSQDVTPANSVAMANFSVTGTATYAVSASCTDRSGNASTAAIRNVTIDLDVPTCTLTAPATGAYATNRLLTTVAVVGADGRPVTIRSDLQVAPITTTLVVTTGTASAILQYPKGVQTVTAEVQDLAGNACTPGSVSGVNVTSDACSLELRNVVVNAAGSWKNRSATSALSNLTATTGDMSGVIANSADCRSGERVTLQKTAPGPVGSVIELVTAANGDVVLATPVGLTDGDTWTVTSYSATATPTTADIRVGLRVPSATGVTLNGYSVAAGQPLYFVAPSDNFNLNPAAGTPKTDRYFADQAASTPGAQASIVISNTSGLVYGSSDGRIDVLYTPATVPLATQAVAVVGFTTPSIPLTLDHDTTGTLTVRLTSAAGNVADILAASAAVDVIAPAQPAMTPLALASARDATLNAGWSTVYDDGVDSTSPSLSVAAGAPFERGYDLRWTTTAVYGNAALANDSAFFSSSNVSTVVHAATALDVPPLNTYFVVARARDEVGNYSAFLPAADPLAVTKTQTLINMWGGDVLLSVAGAAGDFGTTVAAESSVIGDSIADVVVSSPGRGNVGSVYVFRGQNPFNGFSGACSGANCQELTPPDGLGTLFGSDVSINGNVADDTTDPTTLRVSDIVIGQRSFTATGRAFIFLGTNSSAISKSIEIRGDAANISIGYTTRILNDIDGDGYDELAISAVSFGGGRGRIYLFKGRSFADWQTAFVSGQNYVSVTSADWVIEAESVLSADPANASNGLGLARLGLISLPGFTGRLRTDGGVAPEVVVPLARVNLSRSVIYGFDRLRTSSVAAPLGVLDGGIQTLSQTPVGASANTAFTGFSASAFAGAVQGGTDLYVGFPYRQTVTRFSNWGSGGVPGGNGSGTITGPVYFGQQITAGNLDRASSQPDLVVAEGSPANNGVWVLYQRAAAFPAAVGGTNLNFWTSEFRPMRLGSASAAIRIVAVGDVDGVNGQDLVIADMGSVHIWR